MEDSTTKEGFQVVENLTGRQARWALHAIYWSMWQQRMVPNAQTFEDIIDAAVVESQRLHFSD